MKAQFLKIAGVKSEREFYQRFPTEESFFKAFPEALKSAHMGVTVPGIVDGMGMGMPGISGTDYSSFNEQLIPLVGKQMNVSLPSNTINLPKIQNTDPTKLLGENAGFDIGKLVGPAQGITKGIQQIKAQKQQLKKAQQTNQLSGIYKTLSGIREEQPERRYVRPEDSLINPNQLYPSTGVGTNVLAKNGKNIDSYQFGGELSNLFSQGGLENIANSGIVDKGMSALFPDMADSGGATIGGAIGEAAGNFIPIPVVGPMIGKTVGKLIGGAFDKTGKKIKKEQKQTQDNMSAMMINNGATGMHQANYSYMEDGGLIPLMEEGGELQTHWGGHAETVSQNPYLEDGGETIMFRGNSHDESDNNGNTGIGITYGNSPVEVERGEPATKINDELVVYGNLQIPNQYVELFGDDKAKGKKFKNYVKEISKDEEKQNKFLEKSITQLNELNPLDPFDKLKFNALRANVLGANAKLKDIAEKKKIAANLQEAINTTAEEYGVEADALSKGKLKYIGNDLLPIAKNGKNLNKEIYDDSIEEIAKEKGVDPNIIKKLINKESGYSTQSKSNKGARGIMQLSPAVAQQYGVESIIHSNKPEDVKKVISAGIDYYKKMLDQNNGDYLLASAAYNGGQKSIDFVKEKLNKQNITGNDWINYMTERRKTNPSKNKHAWQNETYNYVTSIHDNNNTNVPVNSEELIPITTETTTAIPEYLNSGEVTELPEMVISSKKLPMKKEEPKKSNLLDVISSVIPNMRPSDAQGLDYNQLLGEMYALGTNQLEPVQAQSYQPQLRNPYDISLQDILNENQADYKAQQRMVGNNPAAQAMLNAQKYAANQKVLGEQFRLNQANKDQVYSGNINTLNDAKLKNLAIYDQQYDRQASARANTKATTQAALNSISSKYLQNDAANRKLQIYENLYGFRFDDQGRAINQNGPVKFNSPQITDGQDIPVYDDNGNIVEYRRPGKKQTVDSVRTLPINPEKTTDTKSKGKNGKNLNSSIVKAMKNL